MAPTASEPGAFTPLHATLAALARAPTIYINIIASLLAKSKQGSKLATRLMLNTTGVSWAYKT